VANTHAIKARIKSVENIRQITKSMKMVAASKLRRVQTARGSLALMAEKSREILQELTAGEAAAENPFLAARPEVKQSCYVLFVGNRGLCGVYNSALLHFLETEMARGEGAGFVVICGSWGQDIIEPSGLNVRRRFADMSDVPDSKEARQLSDYLKKLYLAGEADRIVMVYQKYLSVLQQQPCAEIFLPLQPPEGEAKAERERIFEPDRKSVLDALTELYVSSTIFSAMLEARMGEHAARMCSMNAAADSTEELMGKLKQALNHARQAAITTEISEIVGGAQALSENNGRD